MPIATPYGNPNWFKRQNRIMTPRALKTADMNDPQQAAQSMYGAGLQVGEDGKPRPTRDYGSLLRLNSSQMNSLSRGAKPGSFSSLGQPMNSMYANNPGFFNRDSGRAFADKLAQRNQAAAQPRPVDSALLEKRGFGSPTSTQTPAAPTPEANRANLEDRASGLRLLREVNQPALKVTEQDGGKNLVGKYGTGWSAPVTPGKKNEGMINGRPASEVLQGLANKPGLARPGDKYQPKKWTAEELRRLTK